MNKTLIYPAFIKEKSYTQDLQDCIESTVDNLINKKTNIVSPGMLLGKIQSGKTKTFIGVIALAFDRGYNISIIFTKGTKALAEQTYQRLDSDFRESIENDVIKVYDIMNIPDQLTPYIRRQKLIIVVKKETNNLSRLVEFLKTYTDLTSKKVLIIDDEADFASIGFKRDRAQQDGVSMNVLATKINSIRSGFENNYGFLQVTATPYSLYLQPRGEIELNDFVFKPIRPAFTTLVPIHDQYIGGKEYFEDSLDPESVFSHLYIQVPDDEIDILNRRDQRYISNILSTPNLRVFRQSIINYIVAGSIRIIQSESQNKNYKSSFIVHASTIKNKHQWQSDLTIALIDKLKEIAVHSELDLETLVKESYDNFVPSINKNGDVLPDFTSVYNLVKESLVDGFVGIVKVNSENQIAALLNRNGQLRLDNPFNIFIGGQILDRGLTIDNLIGFFYGRNPRTFQQDTVLQHSRMYGARSMKDLAVMRLYTSNGIYRALRTMHGFDSALRDAFEKGIHDEDAGVVFIERDNIGEIRPCAPNKVLITATETIRPFSRFLPVGFQTKAKTTIQRTVCKIDEIVNVLSENDLSRPFLIDFVRVIEITNLIESTYEYNDRWNNIGYEWDINTFISIIKRLVDNIQSPSLNGRIYCYVQTGRNISRMKNNNTAFTDAPDDGRADIPTARNVAIETPCLILLKQTGLSENGWRDVAFWWPVLISPGNTRTAIFARETID